MRIKVIEFRQHGVRLKYANLVEACQDELDEVSAVSGRVGFPEPMVV